MAQEGFGFPAESPMSPYVFEGFPALAGTKQYVLGALFLFSIWRDPHRVRVCWVLFFFAGPPLGQFIIE